jgi:hypothetical protein
MPIHALSHDLCYNEIVNQGILIRHGHNWHRLWLSRHCFNVLLPADAVWDQRFCQKDYWNTDIVKGVTHKTYKEFLHGDERQ